MAKGRPAAAGGGPETCYAAASESLRATVFAGMVGAKAAIIVIIAGSFLIDLIATGRIMRPGQTTALLPIPVHRRRNCQRAHRRAGGPDRLSAGRGEELAGGGRRAAAMRVGRHASESRDFRPVPLARARWPAVALSSRCSGGASRWRRCARAH